SLPFGRVEHKLTTVAAQPSFPGVASLIVIRQRHGAPTGAIQFLQHRGKVYDRDLSCADRSVTAKTCSSSRRYPNLSPNFPEQIVNVST
ncbi:hypothetical protein FA95DRAFT_1496047, partial [Auriscalpium vulgare]